GAAGAGSPGCQGGRVGARQHRRQIGRGRIVGAAGAAAMPAEMVDVDLETGMALGDLAESLHVAAGQQADWIALLLAGVPEPVERPVGPPCLLLRLVEGEAEAEHARPRAPVLDDLFAVRRLQHEIAEDAELVRVML